MIKRYLDFELKIYSDGKEIEIDINGRPRGISLPNRLKLPLMLQPINYKSLTPDSAAIAATGHSLFEFIFSKEVGNAFTAYLNRRTQTEGVRICIDTQSNVLGEWIWEILCSQLQPAINFLALDPKTPIIRIARVGKEVYERELQLPLRMLVVLAWPGPPHSRIDVGKEKDLIEESLRNAIAQRLIIIDYLGFDEVKGATYDSLQERLAGQTVPYDVVHIIAHGVLKTGEEGEVAFTRPADGGPKNVTASSLAGLFQTRGVMLVVLQSCQGGAVDPTVSSFSSVAQQLVAAGVPAVLAMQDVVDQDVAADFIGKLYKQWITAGTPFEDALTQARQSLRENYKESIAPWAVPVFYIVPGLQLILRQHAPPVEEEKTRAPLQTTVTERLVDAALPRQMRVGKETDLLVLIRTPSAPGLREKLGAEPDDFEATSDDVLTSPPFDVVFKKDEETGKLLPFVVKVSLETKDFELERREEKVQVRPQGDSILSIFSVTAKKKGPARILIRVLDTSEQEVTLAQILLRIDVRTGKTFETEYMVMETTLRPFSSNTAEDKKDNDDDDLSAFDRHVRGGVKDYAGSIMGDESLEHEGERENAAGNVAQETKVVFGDSSVGTATGTASRSRMVIGFFTDRESVERVYRSLADRGYGIDDVNLIMADETRKRHFSDDSDSDLGTRSWEGAGRGTAIGGTVGGTLAALAAIGTTVALPGLGLLVSGPIAAGLAGAGAGGMMGGLIGGLVGSGIPEDRAKEYDRGVREGGILMGVNARSDEDAEYFEKEFRINRGEHVYR